MHSLTTPAQINLNPGSEYASRLESRRAWVAKQQRLHIQIGNLRFLVGLIAAGIGWMAFSNHSLSASWLAAPVVAFIALFIYHERVRRERNTAQRAESYYERAIARIEDRWAGTGESGERFRDPAHPYAEDLDLFGKGSLFELLSTARTRGGEDTLSRWLLAPADAETVRERQSAVAELRPMLDLREDLALLGENVAAQAHPDALIAWAEAPAVLVSGGARIAISLLSFATLTAAVFWLWGPAWLGNPIILRAIVVFFVLVSLAVRFQYRHQVLRATGRGGEAAHDLSLFAQVLSRLERERFTSPRLTQLRSALEADGALPSQRIGRLNRLMELYDSHEHELMRFIGPPLLYDTQLAFAIEAWRARSGRFVRAWVEAVSELEALGSLAGYAYERPHDPFPEIVAGDAHFEAEGLGHPLLPEARCVRNDLSLGGERRLFVVSGSNMSGKSTLLRSVGVSAVMAMAGAPVRARRLRISIFDVGASIRTSDSIQDGTSRFYAEITRLRKLVDLAAGRAHCCF